MIAINLFEATDAETKGYDFFWTYIEGRWSFFVYGAFDYILAWLVVLFGLFFGYGFLTGSDTFVWTGVFLFSIVAILCSFFIMVVSGVLTSLESMVLITFSDWTDLNVALLSFLAGMVGCVTKLVSFFVGGW